MADLAEVKSLLEQALPGAAVTVTDMGGGDHLAVAVAAPQFAG
jgi:acid stress-induced BolA-like protein IbaG/YrbA